MHQNCAKEAVGWQSGITSHIVRNYFSKTFKLIFASALLQTVFNPISKHYWYWGSETQYRIYCHYHHHYQLVPTSCCKTDPRKYPRIVPDDGHCIYVPTNYNSHWSKVGLVLRGNRSRSTYMRYKYYIYSIIGNNSAGIYILIFIEKKMLISRGGFATLNIIQYNFHSSPDYSSLNISSLQGCLDVLLQLVSDHLPITMMALVSLIIFQAVAIVTALCLLCLHSGPKKERRDGRPAEISQSCWAINFQNILQI